MAPKISGGSGGVAHATKTDTKENVSFLREMPFFGTSVPKPTSQKPPPGVRKDNNGSAPTGKFDMGNGATKMSYADLMKANASQKEALGKKDADHAAEMDKLKNDHKNDLEAASDQLEAASKKKGGLGLSKGEMLLAGGGIATLATAYVAAEAAPAAITQVGDVVQNEQKIGLAETMEDKKAEAQTNNMETQGDVNIKESQAGVNQYAITSGDKSY